MPRDPKPARLWLRPAEHDAAGRLVRHAQWIIKHAGRRIGTGCRAEDRAGAERALSAHILAAHDPRRRDRDADRIPVADAINLYLRDVVALIPVEEQRRRAARRATRLLDHFGEATLSGITGAACRAYAAARGGAGGARRELQDLSAAVRHHHREGLHREDIRVWLPPAGGRRERWLTRGEIARLVWAAWTMREQMRRARGDEAAARLPTRKRTGRHIARAILFAYYTASRPGDALRASFLDGPGRSYVDLDRLLYYRQPRGKRATKKRQPPVRLGDRIARHLARWRAAGAQYVVEWEGLPVASIKTGLARAVAAAGLPADVSLYALRHSRITHLKQRGLDSWAVGGSAGTSEAMIEKHYGHHSPDYQERVANAR